MNWPAALVAWSFALGACGREPGVGAEPGRPLPHLTEDQLGRFLLGKAVFERLTVPEEGLGPLYNAERCSACHDVPVTGGSGPLLVLKATRFEGGRCDLLTDEGGDNVQQRATPLLAARGVPREAIPRRATATTRATGPSLYGLGLVEAIPDDAILKREDPDDADHDGISGRAPRTPDGRIARFGRKGEAATVLDFVDTALRFELGLTTPLHPAEETVNGTAVPPATDPKPEPEIDARGMNLLADFVRFLAPPARALPASRAARDSVAQGEGLFGSTGCASCHVPVLHTGRSAIAALDRRPVPLYSDLLLHDMGPGLADVCGSSASPSEYRTARLWGLRYRELLLHHGGARSAREAIAFHGGEAAAARTAFERLAPAQQATLLRFLASL